MKRCYLLMVAALIVRCAAASTSIQSGLSEPLAGEETFLRSLRAKTKVGGEEDEEEEERVGGNFDKVVNKLADKMADDIPSMVKMFERWKKLTTEEIFKTPAGAVLAKASNEKFLNLFNLYGEFNLLGKKAFIDKLERIKANRIKAAAQR
ncbi:hypothetical protein PHYPSEUDO_007320 [Phytophthora pseudosyringae]|uniref:RxLR effector protein n=1 Tax=Phytophthora pseudosyringae TaxID=221518 RepID=A0A8T1VJG1_9STRA|nr:hypothetical protein PHYPSEUDO_007320 [Phytophthora pseudosyringae]